MLQLPGHVHPREMREGDRGRRDIRLWPPDVAVLEGTRQCIVNIAWIVAVQPG
jgi:hypothetical protein